MPHPLYIKERGAVRGTFGAGLITSLLLFGGGWMLGGWPCGLNSPRPGGECQQGAGRPAEGHTRSVCGGWKMEIDDEDPAWLEACMAAVDSIPVANLDSTASRVPASAPSNQNRPAAQQQQCRSSSIAPSSNHVAGGSRGPSAAMRHASHVLPSGSKGAVAAPMGGNTSFGGVGSTTAPAPLPGAVFRVAGGVGHFPHNSNSSDNAGSRGFRRNIGGVGVSPGDGVQTRPDRGNLEVDPCWRCGEPTKFVEFGATRYFGCSSYPLCGARRTTRRNGAVVELIAAEKRPPCDGHAHAQADTGASAASECSPGDGASNGIDQPDPTGITRCQLCVKVRGGHKGGAAQAAWAMLRRNGIVPTPTQEQGGVGGRDGGRSCNASNSSSAGSGSSSGGGSSGAGSSGTGAGGVAGTEELKAILELGKRDAVKRLLKQEGLAYRDIPQTTYTRLIASGAGEKIPTPSQARRGGKGKAKKDPDDLLLPLDGCDALLYTLPADLRETLLPFQRDGVLYGLRRKGRCLIADEMGTGKTLQALGVMGCYREDWPLLIVAPASMRLMWAEEVEHWYPFLEPSQIHLIKGNKDKLYLRNMSRHLWPRVVIVSYYMLRMLADSVGKDDWKAVIFDESHMISTRLGDEAKQALQVTVCVEVAKRAKRVVMLSGTPSLSMPFQIFNQVEALSPGLLGKEKDPLHKAKTAFASNYCGGTTRAQTSKSGAVNRVAFMSGSRYPDELHLLLKNEVMIRRLKNNVVKQLPPLRRIVVRVLEHGQDLRRALKAGSFEADVDFDNDDGGARRGGVSGRGQRGAGIGAGLMSDDQRAGLKKVKSASEWVVDKLISSQETLTKFVVFAHHKTVLDLLQEAFEVAGTRRTTPFFTTAGKAKAAAAAAAADAEGNDNSLKSFTCLRIDGSVPTPIRASRLAEFNSNKLCRVLVVSITAGGQGLDFTAASNVVFVELPESPAWLRQAEDRLHRRRQEKSVNVYLMVLPAGSQDDTRWLSLNQKLKTQTSVMNGTLAAENIDVDKVCDAGGVLDNDDPTPSYSRSRASRNGSRHRLRGSVAPKPQQQQHSHEAAGGDVSEDDTAFDYGDGDGFDSNGDDLNSDRGSSRLGDELSDGDNVSFDGDGGGDGGGETETDDLDAELKMALMSTPSDAPTHRPSQSPTLQLLRAIVQRPASDLDLESTPAKPNIFSVASSGAAKRKNKNKKSKTTKSDQLLSSSSSKSNGLGIQLGLGCQQRQGEQPKASTTTSITAWKSGATTMQTQAQVQRDRETGKAPKKTKATPTAASPPAGNSATAGASASAREGAFASPATSIGASRKRPRSSPGSANASSPSSTSSGNPFIAFGHRPSRPPPPSPSSRLGVGVGVGNSGSPPPSRSRPASSPVADPDALGASSESGGVSDDDFVAHAPKASRTTTASTDSRSGGRDRGRSRRGTPGTPAAVASPSSFGGDGSVSSPVSLVDLSQEDDDGKSESVGIDLDLKGAQNNLEALGGASSTTAAAAFAAGAAAEKQKKRDNGAPAGMLSFLSGHEETEHDELCAKLEGGEGGRGVEERGWKDQEGKGGGHGKEEEKGEGGGGQEELLATRLCFLVSGNSGRVHVYKKQEKQDKLEEEGGLEDDDDDGGYSFDDDEDRKPQHCRCNFRPEDLDRLFETAKEALSLSSSSSPSSASAAVAAACEVAAKEALSMLPSLLRSAPALKLARVFVQEWRGLTSRKRELLKKNPCRPPLADELQMLTPALIGSTRRYAGTTKAKAANSTTSSAANISSAGGCSSDISSAPERSKPGKVMCLFCEEQAASEQGRPVHPRDRFCSVDCMEAHGSRNSNTSLRRLVLERDQGVCSAEGCGRDCLALVSRLTAVQNHERRRDILVGADPRFGGERHRALLERLVRHPKGGNAWNADHVTAVYQGGGECGVDNLRTLCVLCHAEVTRVQTIERAAARRLDKENKRRLLEEAQGQRRLVSFGGGIALSAGSSQGSSAGIRVGGGSRADACEISSDGSDTNGNSSGNVSCEDEGDAASPFEKRAHARSGTAKPRGPAAGKAPSNTPTTATRLSQPDSEGGRLPAGRNEPDCSKGSREKTGMSGIAGKPPADRRRHGKRRERRPRSSLEAFDRIISGEDFGLESLPSSLTGNGPVPPEGDGGGEGGRCGGAKEGEGGAPGDKGVGDDSDDCCEIVFTRVRTSG